MSEPRNLDLDRFLLPGGRLRVIAHRGLSGLAPENTLAAFRSAIEVGADMIELDVTLSRDRRPVVIHDETLERTTEGEGPVRRHNLAELAALDAGSWLDPKWSAERIPTLEQVLELARGRILVNVEIKPEAVDDEDRADGIEARVAEVVGALGMIDRVLVSSFEPRALERLARREPQLRLASLYRPPLHGGRAVADILDPLGARALHVDVDLLEPRHVVECHRLGRTISVYTVNDPQRVRQLVRLGVDGVFTDRADRLLAELDDGRSLGAGARPSG